MINYIITDVANFNINEDDFKIIINDKLYKVINLLEQNCKGIQRWKKIN